jgi:hypothetical protein
MRTAASIILLSIAVACGGSNSDGDGGGNGTLSQPLVSGLRINEVSLYQAVKIPLAIDGNPILDRTAPVVQGRDALMRVFVVPEPGWQPREVIVRLEMFNSQGALPPQEIRRPVSVASSEGDFQSAFNFDIPGAQMTGDVGYAVTIHEVSQDAVGPPSGGARFPSQGAVAMNAAYGGESIKMVLVPVQYFADNSGRLPDLNDQQVELYRRYMHDVYPTPKVEVRIREALFYSQPINGQDDSMADLLQTVLYTRQQDIAAGQATNDEYYYGVVVPRASFGQYCQQGCVLGLTFQTGQGGPNGEAYLRGSVGVGYPGNEAAQTFIHEIGHAHGRKHSPCAPFNQIQSVDPAYPHQGATIGTWGYSLSAQQLLDPQGQARDFMSYCEPSWVSDYTYRGLFEKIAFVNGVQSYKSLAPAQRFRSVTIGSSGAMALGHPFDVQGTPSGSPESVEVIDASGNATTVTGYFHRYDHLPGGMLLVPEPAKTARGLRLRGHAISL